MRETCGWGTGDPEMEAYHDCEWGVPVHDDSLHFEFIVLEGAQAGLSWRTVLHRRPYREIPGSFDLKVARSTPTQRRRISRTPVIATAEDQSAIQARTFIAVEGVQPVDKHLGLRRRAEAELLHELQGDAVDREKPPRQGP
jgi:DNA-3-methyladenine glycosylase I